MTNRISRDWMWSEALELLARAGRPQRETFRLAGPNGAPYWEPPVDVLETAGEIQVVAVLPGVDPEQLQVYVDGDVLVIAGRREPAAAMRRAIIHRLELPQGQFARRVPLPAGRFDRIDWRAENGCLTVTLRKSGGAR